MIRNNKMFAEWLHNTYEQLAREEGWNTQEKTKVGFNKLPKENQRVMLRLAIRIKKQFGMDFVNTIDSEIRDCNTLKRLEKKAILNAKKNKDYKSVIGNMQGFLENEHAIYRLKKLKDRIIDYTKNA